MFDAKIEMGSPLNTSMMSKNEKRRVKKEHQHHRSRKELPMGYQKLSKCLELTTDEAITAIDKNTNSFSKLCKHYNLKDEVLILLIEVLGGKICGTTSLPEMQRTLIGLTMTTEVLLRIRNYTYKLAINTKQRVHHRSHRSEVSSFALLILEDLCAYYSFVLAKMQDVPWSDLQRNLDAASFTIKSLQKKNHLLEEDTDCIQELQLRFDSLVLQVQNLQSKTNTENGTGNKKIIVSQVANSSYFLSGMSDVKNSSEIAPLYLVNPPNKFVDFAVIPTMDEIFTDEEPFLWPNLVKGRYPSALNYLDVQYRLLREDFVAPFREALNELARNISVSDSDNSKKLIHLDPGGIRLYQGVTFFGIKVEEEKTLYTMRFSSPLLTFEEWIQNSWLLPGSLLLLTSDMFKTIYFATVDFKDERELAKGFVDIIWEGPRPLTYENMTFLMIESEAYFVSYRYTMKALQLMAEPAPPHYDRPLFEKYPMAKYIVDMSTGVVPPPLYLRQAMTTRPLNFSMLLSCNTEEIKKDALADSTENSTQARTDPELELDPYKFLEPQPTINRNLKTHYASAGNLAEWPTASEIGMDSAQFAAFHSAVTQEICVIQGPPGTGKTYIGLQLMKLFLSNPQIFTSPIFIVCRTNHALDQFLEGIVSIMRLLQIPPSGKLVRVGGGSKTFALSDYNLRQRRNEYRELQLFDEPYAQSRAKARAVLGSLKRQDDDLKGLYWEICHPKGIIDFQRLAGLVNIRPYFEGVSKLSPLLLDCFLNPWPGFDPEDSSQYDSPVLKWLGLTAENFRNLFSEVFDPEKLIRQWFSMNSVEFQKHLEVKNNKESSTNKANINGCDTKSDNNNATKNDEGSRIINANVNRIIQEVFLQFDEDHHKLLRRLPYLFEFYQHNFGGQEAKWRCQLEESKTRRDIECVKIIESNLLKVKEEKSIFGSIQEFLVNLLDRIGAKKIQLPVVPKVPLLQPPHPIQMTLSEWSWSSNFSMSEKWAVYFHLVEETKAFLLNEIMEVQSKICVAQEKYQEVKNRGDGIILEGAKVVGMTTTGAAKYGTWVRMIQPKIVIVEEAAEVLESHIVTSITEYCEHLILIGDHKQLRPQTNVYKLSKDYNFNLSLFERLVNNNIKWCCLKTQHRMRPEICKLLVPAIYKELENHPTVLNYPDVAGFTKNLFFIRHTEYETKNDDVTKSNRYEAKFIVQLCCHIIRQDYQPKQITVLVTYNGQKSLVEQILKSKDEPFSDVRVATVDNYQGEENDIILVSLVRSNEDNSVGFLHTENRICVALSRARIGFYLIGNMDCLLNSRSAMWGKISAELYAQNSIGDQLELKCQIHGDTYHIGSPSDFHLFAPEGGCKQKCNGILSNCKHLCNKFCHIVDREHREYQCQELVKKKLICGHVDELPCFIPIDDWNCKIVTLKKLPCNHQDWMPCCFVPVASSSDYCQQKCVIELPCGHQVKIVCYKKCTPVECKEMVEVQLVCGHSTTISCSTSNDYSKLKCDQGCKVTGKITGRFNVIKENNEVKAAPVFSIAAKTPAIQDKIITEMQQSCCSNCSVVFSPDPNDIEITTTLKTKILGYLSLNLKPSNDVNQTRPCLKQIQVFADVRNVVLDPLTYSSNCSYEFELFRQLLENYCVSGPECQSTVSSLISVYIMSKWWLEAEDNVKQKQRSTNSAISNNMGNKLSLNLQKIQSKLQRLRSASPLLETNVGKPDLTTECRDNLISEYNSIFDSLTKINLPLTLDEIEKFDSEFDRMHDMHRLFIRRNIYRFYFFRGTIPMFNKVKKLVLENRDKVYDEEKKQQFTKMLKTLECLIKSDWKLPEEEERQRIKVNPFSLCSQCFKYFLI